jgi:hypothetical protein
MLQKFFGQKANNAQISREKLSKLGTVLIILQCKKFRPK